MAKLTDEQKAMNLLDFLAGLTKLSKRYKITIGGCGCCGSPYLLQDQKVANGAKYTVSDSDNDSLRIE